MSQRDDETFERWAEELFQPPPAYPSDGPSDEDLENFQEAFESPSPYSRNRAEYSTAKRREDLEEHLEAKDRTRPATGSDVERAYAELFS